MTNGKKLFNPAKLLGIWRSLMTLEQATGRPLTGNPRYKDSLSVCPIINFAPNNDSAGREFAESHRDGRVTYFQVPPFRQTCTVTVTHRIYSYKESDWWRSLSEETRYFIGRTISIALRFRAWSKHVKTR